MHYAKIVSAIALLAGLTACGRPFKIGTPTGFVELTEHDVRYEYRAVTPEGVVIGVRVNELDKMADLDFWRRAIILRMQRMNGYALLEERAVKSRDGTDGLELRFGHDQNKSPHIYVMRIYLAQGRLFIAEAGGRKEQMARYSKSVEYAFETLKVKCDTWVSPVLASKTCNRW